MQGIIYVSSKELANYLILMLNSAGGKNMYLNNFEKQNVVSVYGMIKDFIHDFKGGQEDIDRLEKLLFDVSKYKIAINEDIYNLILGFIEDELIPMIYERDEVFKEMLSYGYIKDGMHHLDNEEELEGFALEFYKVLYLKEEALEEFAMENLYPLLVG